MKWALATVFVTLTGAVAAEPWTQPATEALRAALIAHQIVYPNARQRFYASGKTLYTVGEPSWGNWEIREGALYCSQWPPRAEWACYGLELSADGKRVRFTGAQGDVTEGRFDTD